MIKHEYDLNDIVEMKKEHPCHKSKYWKIIRMGADIRIKCQGCGTSVLFPRVDVYKRQAYAVGTYTYFVFSNC